MTTEDIKAIEVALEIILPEELVTVYMSNLFDGIEDFPELNQGVFIIDSTILTHLNQRLREKGLQKRAFPKYYFAIGF